MRRRSKLWLPGLGLAVVLVVAVVVLPRDDDPAPVVARRHARTRRPPRLRRAEANPRTASVSPGCRPRTRWPCREATPWTRIPSPTRATAGRRSTSRRRAPRCPRTSLSAPTKDPEVLRARQQERERWNVEYGKILSNTATEEEILAYYAERDRLYSDYVAFATYILENHGEQLSIRDLGLLKVAVELNLARLEEIPRRIAEANERRKAHQAAREAWLRDQADFAGGAKPGD